MVKRQVIVVGVGALGSHVVQFLRNVDARMKVIDFDRIEQKNVASQFHTKTAVGRSKAVALQQTMQFLFGTKIDSVPHKLTDENAKQLLADADLIIDCLDNAEARTVVQAMAREWKCPCLHGALAADGAFGRVVWDERFVIDHEAGAGAATCEGGEHLPFVAIVAAHIARAAQEFLAHRRQIGFEINPGGVART